jgi:hypothetical protein
MVICVPIDLPAKVELLYMVLNANIFQTIHRTEIASFKRGELPLSNNTSFNVITSLVDAITRIKLHKL